MTGPLSGVRIVDLSQMATGPLATAWLADQGADVVKVEPPGGDGLRNFGSFAKGGITAFVLSCNRGKRSVGIDLSARPGVDLVRRMVADADVFVQNFRPGVVERLGLDPEVLRADNPGLITMSISGYGLAGPMSDRPVFDPVIQAITGHVATQVNPEIPFPDLVRHIVVDKATASFVAQAVTAALFERERSGQGQHIDLSMVDSSLAFLWPDAMMGETLLDDDVVGGPLVSELYSLTRCADGQLVYWAGTEKQLHGLYRALGHPEWISDERFGTKAASDRLENRQTLGALVGRAFEAMDVADAVDALVAHDVPCGLITDLGEVASQEQVVANESLVEFEHPTAGRVRQPRPPARFARTPADPAWGAPTIGQHTDEILGQLGLTAAQIAEARASGVVF